MVLVYSRPSCHHRRHTDFAGRPRDCHQPDTRCSSSRGGNRWYEVVYRASGAVFELNVPAGVYLCPVTPSQDCTASEMQLATTAVTAAQDHM
jgi:hypothetical protein